MENEGIVFVVDDDEAVRDSIAALLQSAGVTVETFSLGTAFLEQADLSKGRCLIIDVQMPDLTGLEVQERLGEKEAVLPVIIITGHGDLPMAVKAMKAGAMDFIEKPFDDNVLMEGVHQALARSEKLQGDVSAIRRVESNLARLTARELDVLKKIVEGGPNKVIAHELGISPRTVEIHRARVVEKMEARSLSHLVRMAIMAGILA